MNNKKEEFTVRKPGASKKGVAVTVAAFAVIFGVCAYLAFSKNGRGFLGQGGAIAIRSFGDMLAPSSGTIISEVDLASSGISRTADGWLGETVTVPIGAPAENGNHDAMGTMRDATAPAPEAALFAVYPPVDDSALAMDRGDAESPSAPTEAGEVDCSFPASIPADISHRVILNEIAWMGSPTTTGETADHAANREWMELKNISGAEISLSGWRIMDAGGKIKISFGAGDKLLPGRFYLLSRNGGSVSGISPDKAYAGVLPNSGDGLAVLDALCGVSDFLGASPKWPSGSNTTKQTLERMVDLGWQTSAAAGGTPRAENSAGVPAVPVISSSTEKYMVSVAIAGNAGGSITIKPGGAICNVECANEYTKGTTVTLAASPENGADFVGWSGGCSGTLGCSFVVGGPVLVTAGFHLETDMPFAAVDDTNPSDFDSETSSSASSSLPEDASTTNDSSPPVFAQLPTSSSIDHLVIAAIQIVGTATDDDFVKIYNPTSNMVDLSGWKLRKKSSTGTDSSLREFPKGSAIVPSGYFVWASSANGFAQSIGADASSTGTLAANNSVALFDGSGAQVDAVAWGTGTNQYVESSPYPDSPTANQILERKFTNGVIVDTDNNAADFTL